MAIKGKSRKRSKARGPALPPRPAVGARKTPLLMRRDVKRGVVIVLALLAFLGGLRVWQNVSRADALRDYDTQLNRAQQSFVGHFTQDSPTSFEQNIQAFSGGQVPGADFIKVATQWETDFRKAHDAVAKLKPPNKVAEDAQKLIVLGLDGYVGLARLYNLAGQIKQLADAEKDAKKKTELNNKVQVVLQHANEWRTQRADEIYKLGAGKLNDLNIEYGLVQPSAQQTPAQ